MKVGNVASSARWVHGASQAWFHKRHGWRKLNDVTKAELPEIKARVERAIRNIIREK